MADGFIITGETRTRLRAAAAKHGLEAIQKGMRLNTAYTPRNCMDIAAETTGLTFKARDYAGAIAALEEYLA